MHFLKLKPRYGANPVYINPAAIASMVRDTAYDSQLKDTVSFTRIFLIGDDPELPTDVMETPEQIIERIEACQKKLN